MPEPPDDLDREIALRHHVATNEWRLRAPGPAPHVAEATVMDARTQQFPLDSFCPGVRETLLRQVADGAAEEREAVDAWARAVRHRQESRDLYLRGQRRRQEAEDALRALGLWTEVDDASVRDAEAVTVKRIPDEDIL